MFLIKMPSSFPLPKWIYEPILFLIALIVLVGAVEECRKDMKDWQPLPLTPPHAKKPTDVCFSSHDQCMPHPGREGIKSYGLVFARRDGGTCPKGLLVCYESQLHPRSTQTGMVSNPRYGVININGNLVARLCRTFRREYIRKNMKKTFEFEVPQWHGLLVNTTGEGEDGGFGIQLSYTNRTYTIKAEQQFKLLFGNKDDLRTNISTLDEYGLYSEPKMLDEALANAYFRDVHRGAYLKRYAGLWSLGVDMMPHESKNSFKVKVFERSDNEEKCMLDAWFTFPTDGHEPVLPTTKTTTTTTTMTTTTEAPKFGRSYTFNGTTGPKADYFEIHLKKANDSASSSDFWLRLMVGGTDKSIKITTMNAGQTSTTQYGCFSFDNKFECYDDRTEKIRYNVDKQKPLPESLANAIVQIELEIHHYFVQIQFKLTVNGTIYYYKSFEKHWPANWWNGLEGMVDEKMMPEANDDFKMTHYHIAEKRKDWKVGFKKMDKYYSRKFMQEFTNGSKITFRGALSDNMQKFSIKLLRNARQMLPNQKIGDIVLQFDIDFAKAKIILRSQVNGKRSHPNMSYDNISGTLEKNKTFECQIKAIEYVEGEPGFKVDFMQGSGGLSLPIIKSPLPHWAINYLNIIGDVTSSLNLEFPIVEYSEQQFPYLYKLDDPLRVGGNIVIDYIPLKGEVHIYLLHGVSEYNTEIGDVPLHIQIKKQNGMTEFHVGSLNRKAVKNGNNFAPAEKLGSRKFDSSTAVMEIGIVAEKDRFVIHLPNFDEEISVVGSYLYSKANLPPWTVDHISVSVTVPFRVKPKFEVPPVTEKKAVPFTKPLDTSAYKPTSSIKITLDLEISGGDREETKPADAIIFTINFLNGGIFWDKYAVKTPLRFEFYEHHFMCIIDEGDSPKKEPYADQIKLQPKTKLNLEIKMREKGGYQLIFGGSFSQTVEIASRRTHRWLIEHMSIEGNVELVKEPEFSKA